MKQTTAITISMIKSNNSDNNGEQRMTSLEIAQLTGKQHKNIMQSIRNMEPAWVKTTGLNFQLSNYQDSTGRTLPCYSLTKTECLYIATKFNDEARAKLVLRWEELEVAHRGQAPSDPLRYSQECQSPRAQRPQEIRLLACDEEVLDAADEILGFELDELNLQSDHCYTPTEIGKVFGIEGRDLNSFLADQGIIRWARGQWRLTPKYQHRGYTENRCFFYHSRKGRRKMESRLVWTEKGREFLMDLIKG